MNTVSEDCRKVFCKSGPRLPDARQCCRACLARRLCELALSQCERVGIVHGSGVQSIDTRTGEINVACEANDRTAILRFGISTWGVSFDRSGVSIWVAEEPWQA